MCYWTYLSNACFHPQSYLYYAHSIALQFFWTYITEATEVLQSNASCRPLFAPNIATRDTSTLKIILPCSHIWLQVEWYQDVIEQHNSSSIIVMNSTITQTKCLLVWTLCLGWLFISVFFPVYQYLPAGIAAGKKLYWVCKTKAYRCLHLN